MHALRKSLFFLRGSVAKEQARDEHGRFAGGSGATSSRGGAVVARNWSNHADAGLVGKDGKPGTYDERSGTSSVETWHGHFSAHPDQGGVPSADRINSVHAPIMRHFLNSTSAPKSGEKKVAILTMGGPGSGKSSAIKGLDTSNFVKVDPDEIKGMLPEWGKMTDPKNSYRGAAAAAHEESSYLAKQIRDKAIEQGKNVVIDGTGDNADKMEKLIANLKAKGYETHLHYAHVDPAVGQGRAVLRAEGSGRYVPPAFMHRAYDKIPKNFDKIAAAADHATLHDNNGSKPVVTWTKSPRGSVEHVPGALASLRGHA